MQDSFFQQIFDAQKGVEAVPSNDEIASWANGLLCLLFPERANCFPISPEEVKNKLTDLENQFATIIQPLLEKSNTSAEEKSNHVFESLPTVHALLNTDIEAMLSGDPAAQTRFEIVRAYPGFLALAFYRIAHTILQAGIPLLPRILTEYAHSKTGIDIHPGADIGEFCCIDHGTGIVIGETTIVGDHVKIYQGVTLGALSVDKKLANTKRHPTVEDHVILYSGATVLGGETVIGHHSIVGGNVWLTKSIPPHSTVYHKPEIELIENNK